MKRKIHSIGELWRNDEFEKPFVTLSLPAVKPSNDINSIRLRVESIDSSLRFLGDALAR